jgi:hypothetical protein
LIKIIGFTIIIEEAINYFIMNELKSSESKQIKKIRELINELIQGKGLKINQLANYLKLDPKQYSYFYKFIGGDPFPKYLERISGNVLEKFENLLENPDLLQRLKEGWTEEDNSGYGIPPISVLVWIPLDLKLPVADYNGINLPLSIIEIGKKKGIVAFRKISKYEADGEIYTDTIGMATDIEPGTRIAIKRINKKDWQTDRYYLIIDVSGQISIRELLPGNDEKTVKYVSLSSPDGPHKELSLDRIAAIFTIVDGNSIPRPKRNIVTISASQQ